MLHRELGLAVNSTQIGDFPRTGRLKGWRTPPSEEYVIRGTNLLDIEAVRRVYQEKPIRLAAHLENVTNFSQRASEIRELYYLPEVDFNSYRFFKRGKRDYEPIQCADIRESDVVISLRLGDFLRPFTKVNPPHRLLLYDYFRLILDRISFDRLFITSDEPFNPFVNEFYPYDPILVTNESPSKTMALVKRFSTILISQSTYSWWCAFLSKANRVYFPIPKTGPWSVGTPFAVADLDMRVNEERYRYVSYETGEMYSYREIPDRFKNAVQLARDRG